MILFSCTIQETDMYILDYSGVSIHYFWFVPIWHCRLW